MRRGFFVSLAAVLFIGVILATLLAGQQQAREQTALEIASLQNRISANYIDVLVETTIPRTVAGSVKSHLRSEIESIPPFVNLNTIESRVRDDVRNAADLEHERLGLPFEHLEVTDLQLTDWSQIDPWTIEIDYDYAVEALSDPGIEWSIDDADSVTISIIGFEHPGFPPDDHGNITRAFWGVNSSGNIECFLDEITSAPCGSIGQVCPYAYPECRN